ncbi:unnamed protein product [Caenorhabditis angaria]|uniref:BTB domain-containing protein n=1 Tax=Caenorhabditis angaria TaxID=860376 RepID=A0A9P1J221_9PELO|nr:unnamed protein product [Caenorhabditis angaria]
MRSAIAWEQYCSAREQLQTRLAEKIRRQMSTLVGDMSSADLLLVAADGKKLAAHECILRHRAPGFYQRHIEATISAMGPRQEGKMREVAIGDIDSVGLEFFIHSVYTEEEFSQIPNPNSDDRQDSRASNRSYAMEESTTELDFQMSGANENSVEDETPTLSTTGRLPHAPPFFTSPSAANQPPPCSSPVKKIIAATGPYPLLQNNYATQSAPTVPVMTSFRDLASGSSMNSSIYSLGGRSEVADIPEEDETNPDHPTSTTPLDNRPMSKFIRFDSLTNGNDIHKEQLERKRSSGGMRQMFPMFIGLTEGEVMPENKIMSDSWKGSNRLSLSKRLSMTSLTSLTSIDITPGQDNQPPVGDLTACSKLAADLMQMYVKNEDTDCIIRTEDGDIHAHKCILSATCPFFRQQLAKSKRVEMKGFSKTSINFLLLYLYGGVTSIPEDVDVWEIISLATHLNHKDLAQVVVLHMKALKCHWFHRPCAACVSAVFDCLPQLAQIRCMRTLYDEAMMWQAKHFARIWKGRVFLYLNERWQKECYEAVIQYMDDETVIEIILSCERLQVALSRSKSDSAISVLQLVDDILDVAMQFLVQTFHLVISSKSFQMQGKGLALNLGLLEDLLPSVIHSLTPDVAIKTYKSLSQLLTQIQQTPPSPKRSLNIAGESWSPRFSSLIRRMVELSDRHLLHYAASVVNAEAYDLLSPDQKQRIEETGIFVELRQPTAPPPRLSSNSRSYKRSASVGVQNTGQFAQPRAKSAERTKTPQKPKSPEPKEIAPEIEKKPVPEEQKKSTQSGSTSSPQKTAKPVENAAMKPSRSRETVRKSPVKKKSAVDEIQMERQTTHTIISADKIRAAQLPGPDSSPIKTSIEKPKSVVKPMVKDSPLASSANRTVVRDRVSAKKVAPPPSRTSAPAAPTKSAIPTSTKPRSTIPKRNPSNSVQKTRGAVKTESNSIEK